MKNIIRIVWIVFGTAIITAAICIGIIYGWQRGVNTDLSNDYKAQISELELKIAGLEEVIETGGCSVESEEILDDTEDENEVVEDIPEMEEFSFSAYSNTSKGFALQYPVGYEIREEEWTMTDDGETESYYNFDILSEKKPVFGFSTMDSSMEGILKHYKIEGTEEAITVGGLSAEKFKTESMKDGSEYQNVLLKKDGIIYLFTGEGEEFDGILESFTFL